MGMRCGWCTRRVRTRYIYIRNKRVVQGYTERTMCAYIGSERSLVSGARFCCGAMIQAYLRYARCSFSFSCGWCLCTYVLYRCTYWLLYHTVAVRSTSGPCRRQLQTAFARVESLLPQSRQQSSRSTSSSCRRHDRRLLRTATVWCGTSLRTPILGPRPFG